MKELESLKELYLDEIKKINKKGELTPLDGETAMKALEAIDMIDFICEKHQNEGYSEWNGNRYSYPMSRNHMMPDAHYSSRRGRDRMSGRYISRGEYTYGEAVDDMIEELEELKMNAPDEKTHRTIESAINKLRNC